MACSLRRFTGTRAKLLEAAACASLLTATSPGNGVQDTHPHRQGRQGLQPIRSKTGTSCRAFQRTGSVRCRQRAQQQTSEPAISPPRSDRRGVTHTDADKSKSARCFNLTFATRTPKKAFSRQKANNSRVAK